MNNRFALTLAPTYRAANRCVALIVLRELLALRRPYDPR